MSDARERAQEWLKFHDLQIDDLHQLVGDLLAALTTAEREIVECKAAERMLMEALEKAEKEIMDRQLDYAYWLRVYAGRAFERKMVLPNAPRDNSAFNAVLEAQALLKFIKQSEVGNE